MNSLVLIPGSAGLRYARVAAFDADDPTAGSATSNDLRGITTSVSDIQVVLTANRVDRPIDVLTIRAVYGGPDFKRPVLLDEVNRSRFMALGAQAPLCVAKTAAIANEARRVFPDTPIALAFETSFFVDLPSREITYALPSEVSQSTRRWGYHGLFHEAAAAQISRRLDARKSPPRILSICLDPRPEIAAVLGRTPVMVTSGSTPLEGLPGEFNCGEIDPSIALALAADRDIGPERANLLLTRESGFFGMLGWPATLGDVLTEKRARIAHVREHLLYHMALAAGSALAAMESIDGVVFSGRYAEHAGIVASYLLPRIERTIDMPAGSLPWEVCALPLESIVAQAGFTALLGKQLETPADAPMA